MDDKSRDRLAELRALDAERETKAQEDADARELEARELTATLEAKGLVRGSDFQIINNALGGVYALRKPDARAIRAWESSTEKQKLQLEWQVGLLRKYIVDLDEKDPQQGKRGIEWARVCAQRPGLCWETSTAFVELMGVDVQGAQRK